MKRILHTWSRLASDDEGGALVLVLTLVVVAVTLVGIVLAAQVAQFRFVRRDVHRLQARYEAEAGVYAAIDSLQINPLWRARDATFQLPRGLAPVVSAEAFGGFIYVRAIGRSRRVTSTLRALVAAHPEGAHAQALVVWDLNSDVTLAGTTTVTGDVVVGDRGVRTSSFKGHRFTGSVTGTVLPTPELPPPYFSDLLFQETISWAESLLSQVHAAEATASREPLPLPSTGSTQFFPADVVITSADSTLLAGADVVVSGGSILIQGPLEYAPASTFIAAVRLELRGEVRGRHGLFYGRNEVEVSGGVQAAAQVLSEHSVVIRDSAALAHPSVIFVGGRASPAGGNIVLEAGASVDGSLVHALVPSSTGPMSGHVLIADSARVRGAVYNANATELHGVVLGSVATHRLYFYDAPSSYVNWLKDAVVDVSARPTTFGLPLGFSPHPVLQVLEWEEEQGIALDSSATRGSRKNAQLL